MKKVLLPLLLWASINATAQNPLLTNPVKGTISVGDIDGICMAEGSGNVVLLLSSKTGVYAVDIADNNASNVAANTITSIPSFCTSKLNPVAGQSVYVIDMEVNPISRSVYILAIEPVSRQNFLFKVEKNGANVTQVNLANVTYSKLSWGGDLSVNDMAFGDNTLYVSSGNFSLDGELGWIKPPFANNATFTKRSTTFFKSNWGAVYDTKAPLETIALGPVDGKNRLMGVTTCAPGFSIDASKLAGTGVLKVTEDFNVYEGYSSKVVYMHHDKNDWLFANHDNNIYRLGKKYLDGSQVTANKYDNNAVELRDNSGKVVSSIPATDMKLMASKIDAMAYWDPYRMLVLESGATGALKLSQMSTETPPPASIENVNTQPVAVYPNPANGTVTIALPSGTTNAKFDLIGMDGKIMLTSQLASAETKVNISTLPAGNYTMHIQNAEGYSASSVLTVK